MKKRCFLAGRNDTLFKTFVANLLNGLIDELDMQESSADDLEGLLAEISDVELALILLDDSSPFSGDSLLVQILIHKPDLPVIVLSENSNLMHVVRRETTIIHSSKELVNAINLI